MKNIEISRVEVQSNQLDFPDSSQISCILSKLAEPIRLMAWLMYETAARLGEIQSLRNLDFNRDTISFTSRKPTAFRVFKLTAELANCLLDYRAKTRRLFLDSGRCGEGALPFSHQWLFPLKSVPGFEHVDYSCVIPTEVFSSSVLHTARISGYSGGFHSHTLRLCCARKWLDDGCSTQELHARLDHSDIMTTLMMAQALRYGGLTYTQSLQDHGTTRSAITVTSRRS
ncbi:MAG TPA: site-specific integrase [Kiritimatiellia bacterium]|nr:site-specific integrase [Kiritimatiellia bacterium]